MRRSISLVGREISAIPTPALLLDLDALDYNIDHMASLFKNKSCSLRPHVKSHKCITIAQLQMKRGAIGMTCAKIGEAEVLVNAGIPDVLVANQVVDSDKIAVLSGLARYSQVTVAVDNRENCFQLSSIAKRFGTNIGVLVEVDVGLNRCGVSTPEEAAELAKYVTSLDNVQFRGIMAYEGSLCGLKPDEKRERVNQAMGKAMRAKQAIESEDILVKVVSGGGTGTWHLTGDYPGVTEIQPGSYVHMEIRYLEEGHPFKSALTVLSTVISKSSQNLILDAGVKAVTQDQGLPRLVGLQETQVRLDEEHGRLTLTDSIKHLTVGDKVQILPSHCCTTVNLYDYYHCIRKGSVEGIWEVSARGSTE